MSITLLPNKKKRSLLGCTTKDGTGQPTLLRYGIIKINDILLNHKTQDEKCHTMSEKSSGGHQQYVYENVDSVHTSLGLSANCLGTRFPFILQ